MINLIPQSAKKMVKLEYIVRVMVVAAVLISLISFVAMLVAVPQLVLLRSQHAAIEATHSVSTQENQAIDEQVAAIELANEQVQTILTMYDVVPLTPYFDAIKKFESDDVLFTSVSLKRTTLGIPSTVTVSGEAATRERLANLKEQLEADPFVNSVDLPLENLAKDTDISFRITVHVTSTPSRL